MTLAGDLSITSSGVGNCCNETRYYFWKFNSNHPQVHKIVIKFGPLDFSVRLHLSVSLSKEEIFTALSCEAKVAVFFVKKSLERKNAASIATGKWVVHADGPKDCYLLLNQMTTANETIDSIFKKVKFRYAL